MLGRGKRSELTFLYQITANQDQFESDDSSDSFSSSTSEEEHTLEAGKSPQLDRALSVTETDKSQESKQFQSKLTS